LKASQVEDWLRERYPNLQVGESTVRLYVRDLRKEHGIKRMTKERQYVAVQELPPGQQIQVDFGMVSLSHEDGSETRGRFIAFVLAHSRYKYVEWLDRPFKVADMVRCHENAFRFFGGRTRELVYDQDALVAVNENNGDLLLTESFQSYVSFRGFQVHLCRARDPESKGKVERVVQYVKSNFVSGRSYHHLREWNQRCLEWLERTANYKKHDTTKKRPSEVHSLEKLHLHPISSPVSFETNLVSSVSRTVHKDNTIRYKGSRYSVPVGTYRYEKPRIVYLHERTSGDAIVIVDHETGEVLGEHHLALERGTLVQSLHHEHDLVKRKNDQTEDVYALYKNYSKAVDFLDEIVMRYPRYIRDQFDLIRDLGTNRIEETVNEMGRLYDIGQVSANLLRQNLLTGPEGITVSMRALDPYIHLMTGATKK